MLCIFNMSGVWMVLLLVCCMDGSYISVAYSKTLLTLHMHIHMYIYGLVV